MGPHDFKTPAMCLILIFLISSCSVGDENGQESDFSFELVKIDSVVAPDTLQLSQKNQFKVFYTRPSPCYEFARFDFSLLEKTAEVAVVNAVYNNEGDCNNGGGETTIESFSFMAQNTGFYTFKFYQGDNDQGEAQYLEIEIPVE